MANIRYKTTQFAGINAIVDRAEGRTYPFGFGPYVNGAFAGTHRREYSTVDAQYLCDWLNGREAIDSTLAEIRKRHDP